MIAPALVVYGALGGGWAPTGVPSEGVCGVCGRPGDVWEALGALSRRFSSWDLIEVDRERGRRLVCAGCAWALVSPGGVRRERLLVSADGGVRVSDWVGVAGRLREGALGADECVVAPVGGKKAVLPLARWGCVCSDPGALPWGAGEARAARAGLFLHESGGALERDLGGSVPPGGLLAGLEPGVRSRVRAAWRVWGPWASSQWCGVMIRAARGERLDRKSSTGRSGS